MNKTELAAKIANDAGLTKKQARRVLDSFIETTTAALKAGDKVTLAGFGTFRVVKRAARIGRNPRTGQELKIAARNYGKFRPGKALKDIPVKPVEEKPKRKVKAHVEVSTILADRKREVGKTLGPLVDRLKRKIT